MSARAVDEIIGDIIGKIIATAIMVVNTSKNRRILSPPLFLELPTYAAQAPKKYDQNL
jgi:hypothetical protein